MMAFLLPYKLPMGTLECGGGGIPVVVTMLLLLPKAIRTVSSTLLERFRWTAVPRITILGGSIHVGCGGGSGGGGCSTTEWRYGWWHWQWYCCVIHNFGYESIELCDAYSFEKMQQSINIVRLFVRHVGCGYSTTIDCFDSDDDGLIRPSCKKSWFVFVFTVVVVELR